MEVIPSGFRVVIISTISKRIDFVYNLSFKAGCYAINGEIAPCVVVVRADFSAKRVENAYYIALEVLLEEVALVYAFGVGWLAVFEAYGGTGFVVDYTCSLLKSKMLFWVLVSGSLTKML